MNITKTLSTLSLSAATLAMAAGPAFALDLSIIGNGSDSSNDIRVRMRSRMSQMQSNEVLIENVVEVESNTGDNKANDNTGGNVKVQTGDVNTTVTIGNAGGTNINDGDDCGCDDNDGEVTIEIKNNGSDSENEAKYSRKSIFERMQNNIFATFNGIGILSETGDNEANDNTGEDGDVDINTGDEFVDIYIENVGAANEL